MQIECQGDPSVFETDRAEWNELTARSLTQTPFQLAEFQRVWWRHFGGGDLCVLKMRDEAGRLSAIAPLFVDPADGGTVRWVGGEEIADYLDIIAPPETMEDAARAVWRWLNSPDAPRWNRMALSNIPEWTPTPQTLKTLAVEAGWRAETTQIDVCPVIQLPNTFDAYLKQIDGKQRQEINRKLRRAQASESAVTWYIVDSGRDLAAETESFMDLMASASPDKAAFLTPKMRAAFRELFPVMHKAGVLQLAFLEVDKKKTAAYAQFDYAGRIWVYNSGIRAGEAAALSPGWVLLARLIENAVNTQRTVYDFMQGSEEYKYRFGGKDTAVFRLTIEK